MGSVLLLDTSSLMYRAFFALPQSMTDAAGDPVNAVHGYLNMTARLFATYAPDRVTHVLDDDYRPAERVQAIPEYKAARPPDPESLPPQFDLLDSALAALGAEIAAAPGWEADDAIASLCTAADGGDRVDIVTGDRDMLALVRDAEPVVRVLFTVKGVSELKVFDEAAVAAAYGVPPARYGEFAMLRGDPSDGLPGVPGVGAKTAARLIAAYPSIAALLDDADAHPPKLAQRLTESRAYLAAAARVVPMRRDVRVELRHGERDEDGLRHLAESGGLGGPIRRLTEAMGCA